MKLIDDPEVFEREIGEQKGRLMLKEKLKKISQKDLVAKRENDNALFNSQLSYFNKYTGINPQIAPFLNENNEGFDVILNRLKEQNTKRKNLLLNEGRALFERGYNRII